MVRAGASASTMARPKGKRSERDDVAVKVDREIVDKARFVALRRHLTLAGFLSDLLRGPVDRAYQDEVRKLVKEEGGER